MSKKAQGTRRPSQVIHDIWREVEDFLTGATGPILLIASAIAAADIFSNHALSIRAQWIPVAWAAARALAVTIWLGVAFGFYLSARARDESGFWWMLLSAALFYVDLQTALLFAIEDEHIAAAGLTIPGITMPPLYWAFEQAVLGVILLAVHRALDHQTHAVAVQPSVVTIPAQGLGASVAPRYDGATSSGRAVSPAYWQGAVGPIGPDDLREAAWTPGISHLETPPPSSGAGDGEEDEAVLNVYPSPERKPRRADSGHQGLEKQERIQRLMKLLTADPNMSVAEVEQVLNVSRGTAASDRREAKRRLGLV